MVQKNGGHEITSIRLHVRVEVPGLDEATFKRLAEEADRVCPVSNLLRNGANIEIDANLNYT
jgi:osmotically inducible protein OsmC